MLVRVLGAAAPDSGRAPGGPAADSVVLLGVLEALRGGPLPDTLRVEGRVVDADLYAAGDTVVPHLFAQGVGGECFSTRYRAGGEHVLLLRRNYRGAWSPYFSPLAPTNVQIRGAGDPWLAWVRAQLAPGAGR